MATPDIHEPPSTPDTQWQTRSYIYYSRYPAIKTPSTHRSGRNRLRRIGMYGRLVMVGMVALLVGGILPLLLSYEIFFKPLITIACHDCQIVGAKPYFEFDYIFATILGVLGFMMPILVLYVFIKITRSRSLRHDIFH